MNDTVQQPDSNARSAAMAMSGLLSAPGGVGGHTGGGWRGQLRGAILIHKTIWIAILVALVVHTVIVFGVNFDYEAEIKPPNPPLSLDLILTPKKEKQPEPEQADFLAEQNRDGMANQERVAEVTEAVQAATSVEQPAESQTMQVVAPPEPPKPVEPPKPKPVPQPKPEPIKQAKPKPVERPKPDEPLDMRAVSLMSRSLAMAKLGAVVDEQVNQYAAMPRERHISARTQEFKYANYMIAWVKKVERVGNLNYPDEARKKNLTGRLILDVSLNPDGEVTAIDFLKRSGHDVLDQAAERIVRAAAPFAPFPADIRKETDVLHITRTWHFLTGNRLSGK